MVRDRIRLCGGLALVLLTLAMTFGRAAADQPQASPAQTAAKGKASPPPATDPQKVVLRYKLAEGESLRYEVTHAAKTLTRVAVRVRPRRSSLKRSPNSSKNRSSPCRSTPAVRNSPASNMAARNCNWVWVG